MLAFIRTIPVIIVVLILLGCEARREAQEQFDRHPIQLCGFVIDGVQISVFLDQNDPSLNETESAISSVREKCASLPPESLKTVFREKMFKESGWGIERYLKEEKLSEFSGAVPPYKYTGVMNSPSGQIVAYNIFVDPKAGWVVERF